MDTETTETNKTSEATEEAKIKTVEQDDIQSEISGKEWMDLEDPKSYTGTVNLDEVLDMVTNNKKLQKDFDDLKKKYTELTRKDMTEEQIVVADVVSENDIYKKQSEELQQKIQTYENTIRQLAIESEIIKIGQELYAINPESLIRDKFFDGIKYDFRNQTIKATGYKNVKEMVEKYKEDNPQQFKSTNSGSLGIIGNIQTDNGNNSQINAKLPIHTRIQQGMQELMTAKNN